jgi:hypothetical protein
MANITPDSKNKINLQYRLSKHPYREDLLEKIFSIAEREVQYAMANGNHNNNNNNLVF